MTRVGVETGKSCHAGMQLTLNNELEIKRNTYKAKKT